MFLCGLRFLAIAKHGRDLIGLDLIPIDNLGLQVVVLLGFIFVHQAEPVAIDHIEIVAGCS